MKKGKSLFAIITESSPGANSLNLHLFQDQLYSRWRPATISIIVIFTTQKKHKNALILQTLSTTVTLRIEVSRSLLFRNS